MEIKTYEFNSNGLNEANGEPKCSNWPVVYLIDGSELYIGETSNFSGRFQQHLSNNQRQNLRAIRVILDDTFNKSAILDIEQHLIRLFNSEENYKLQNMNFGQSASHDYYQRDQYRKKIPEIWNQLKQESVAKKSYEEIVNNNLYKYSPYITLTEDQNNVCYEVLSYLCDCLEKEEQGTAIVEGGAGTGKTILAINMLHALQNRNFLNYDVENDEGDKDKWHILVNRLKKIKDLKIGFVVPMTNLRETLRDVFRYNNLDELVCGPYDIVKQNINYDILFVDESHRLFKRQAQANLGAFDNACKKLKMKPGESTQLNWIVEKSKTQVLFYDSNQSVRNSDITSLEFNNTINEKKMFFYLKSQMRCLGGDSYINHVNMLFESSANSRIVKQYNDSNYDVKVFDDPNKMIEEIKKKDKEVGLCRNLAGYGWQWNTKKWLDYKRNHTYEEFLQKVDQEGERDIDLQGTKYIWNTCLEGWITSEHAIDEIGCIHSSQGFDLNYVGLIFGPEIDFSNNQITVDREKVYDRFVKANASDEQIANFMVNAYKVMLTRGIRGCYMYAYNKGMQAYLKKFFKKT